MYFIMQETFEHVKYEKSKYISEKHIYIKHVTHKITNRILS